MEKLKEGHVWHAIFAQLNPRDRLVCAEVCQDWYGWARADASWEGDKQRMVAAGIPRACFGEYNPAKSIPMCKRKLSFDDDGGKESPLKRVRTRAPPICESTPTWAVFARVLLPNLHVVKHYPKLLERRVSAMYHALVPVRLRNHLDILYSGDICGISWFQCLVRVAHKDHLHGVFILLKKRSKAVRWIWGEPGIARERYSPEVAFDELVRGKRTTIYGDASKAPIVWNI